MVPHGSIPLVNQCKSWFLGWWFIGGRDSSWFLQSPHKFTGKPHPHWNPLCGGESSRWPGPCTPSTPKEMSKGLWGCEDVNMFAAHDFTLVFVF